MNAVVLGATGHIGNAITRELLSRGHRVTATGRRQHLPANLANLPVTYSPGDQYTPGQIEEWIAGQDLVVDAAAPYPIHLALSDWDDLVDSALQRTRQLLRAVRKQGARLAYVSSFTTLKRVRGRIEELPVQLMSRLHPYFTVKQVVETEILDAARRGAPAVVVNPTLCLGPWDMRERQASLIPSLLNQEIPFSTRHMLNVIDVRDVASGLVGMLEAKEYGEATLLSGHSLSVDSLFSWICEIGEVDPPYLSVPPEAGAFLSYMAEMLLKAAGKDLPLSITPMLICNHEWLPPCEVFGKLGITIRPLYQTLIDSIRWFRRIGYC